MEDQFQRNGVFYRTLRADFAIKCPFPACSDSAKQKCQIAFDGTKMHCWVCNARGNYNTIAERLHLKKMPGAANLAYKPIEEALEALNAVRAKPSLPKTVPFDEVYRGLSPEFLARFESQKWFDNKSNAWRILWPVRYNGKLLGYVAGALDKQTMPKYRNGPEGVFRAQHALWPIDDESIKRTVVLVEGPFSALRLLSEGIPAVALLGTGAWNRRKISMLEQRAKPIRNVILAMDGDDAGEKLSNEVYGSIKDRFERVEIFECPVGRDGTKRDPGDMSTKYVEKLRALVSEVKQRKQEEPSQCVDAGPA